MNNLRFTQEQIVWQEVPYETSLAFLISGCPLGCRGCHSADSWKATSGQILTETYLIERLERYQGLLSCVLFMGGEWQPKYLIHLLKMVQSHGLKTCLYTGLEREALPASLLSHLDYLKTGRWIAEKGGLDCPNTNQRFWDLRTQTTLNHLFLKGA